MDAPICGESRILRARKCCAACWLALCLLLFCRVAALQAEDGLPRGFSYVSELIPDARIDIKYYGEDNFVGARVDGYDAPVAIMETEAARALAQVADDLRGQGYGIKIFDAYRPVRAVRHFARWADDPADIANKARFYPDVAKTDLARLGYVAKTSGHSTGRTVDLTLVDAVAGDELDMGSSFDFFGPASHHDSKLVTERQTANRRILRSAMEKRGFRALRTEYWHYSYAGGGGSASHHDFPVRAYRGRGVSASIVGALRAAAGADKLLVTLGDAGSPAVTVYAFAREGRGWALRRSLPGFSGANGIAANRREGSKKTPSGVYAFTHAFGLAPDPGSRIPYVALQADDLWVDDPASKYYNRWVKADVADRDWRSAERLASETVAYRYALALDFNVAPVVRGAGSAIFLHCSTGRPTAGCISVPEEAMVFLMRFVDPDTKIVVAGSFAELLSF